MLADASLDVSQAYLMLVDATLDVLGCVFWILCVVDFAVDELFGPVEPVPQLAEAPGQVAVQLPLPHTGLYREQTTT